MKTESPCLTILPLIFFWLSYYYKGVMLVIHTLTKAPLHSSKTYVLQDYVDPEKNGFVKLNEK